MIIDSTAIVLKRFAYGETSIIARCFVKEIGKVSFMVHGAHRAKSSKAAYFQPANCIDITFYFKENRDLQTISKASFFKSWSVIPNDLKKIAYAMAIIELTDKCNAACPMCMRTNPSGLKPQSFIKNSELTLQNIKHIFPKKVLENKIGQKYKELEPFMLWFNDNVVDNVKVKIQRKEMLEL